MLLSLLTIIFLVGASSSNSCTEIWGPYGASWVDEEDLGWHETQHSPHFPTPLTAIMHAACVDDDSWPNAPFIPSTVSLFTKTLQLLCPILHLFCVWFQLPLWQEMYIAATRDSEISEKRLLCTENIRWMVDMLDSTYVHVSPKMRVD